MAFQNRSQIASDERSLEDQLRAQIVSEIQRRELGPAQIAETLGMLRPSAELLLERRTWPLELSLRVAKGLGMKVEILARSSGD